MSEEEIIQIRRNLTNKWCENKDDLLDEVINVIERLQQQNKELKEQLENAQIIHRNRTKYIGEIECKYINSNRILNELESWLNEKWDRPSQRMYIADVIRKLKELRGSDK